MQATTYDRPVGRSRPKPSGYRIRCIANNPHATDSETADALARIYDVALQLDIAASWVEGPPDSEALQKLAGYLLQSLGTLVGRPFTEWIDLRPDGAPRRSDRP